VYIQGVICSHCVKRHRLVRIVLRDKLCADHSIKSWQTPNTFCLKAILLYEFFSALPGLAMDHLPCEMLISSVCNAAAIFYFQVIQVLLH